MAQKVFAQGSGIVHKGSGGLSINFPDVCKTPAPPAPFVPVPYPNIQYQENLKKANKVDANAKAGGKRAIRFQKRAIESLENATGITVKSATQAVMIGKTVHVKGATYRVTVADAANKKNILG